MANISALNERLKSKIQEEKISLENQSSEMLEQHATSLKKLSKDALSTTKTGIGLYQTALNQLHQDTLQRLKWLLLWPLLASLLLSLVIVSAAGLWSWWTLKDMDSQVQAKQQQIQRLTSEFCASPAGLKVCK